ncbi:hypothetical protein [Desulfurivibrio sp. C05AmB]|uniref:hypothetical protein n=1 Tax=Desulfurivibrio sp. C05AmB TaxID=3374371 RepID=UPI00376EA637
MSKRVYPGLEKIDQVTRIPAVADLLTKTLDAVEKKQRLRVSRNHKPEKKQSADPSRLTPSEIDSLKQAAESAYQSTREKYPNIRFAKP